MSDADISRSRGTTNMVSRIQRRRHHNFCYAVLSLLLVWSSSSISCLVSGEMFKLSYRQQFFQLSLSQYLDNIHKFRRNIQRWRVHPVRTILQGSSATDVLFDLRCGGAAHDEQPNTDGGETIVIDTQPMVGFSVVGNGDTSTSEVDAASSQPQKSDSEMVCAQQAENEINGENSDCTESVKNDEIMGDSNDLDDIPLDVKSDVSFSEESVPRDEESENSPILSDSTISQQVPAEREDANITHAQSHLDLLSSASDHRAEGKTLHDAGILADAALAFRKASSLLDEAITISTELSEDEVADIDNDAIAVERATCRLHEALCLFKDGRPGECIEACTDVLRDGVLVVPLEEEASNNNKSDNGDHVTSSKSTVCSVKVITSPVRNNSSAHSRTIPIPPQIRARALHRRAKARLDLDDLDGALEDARSAAFMGDKNAVQFYGRLMREGSGAGAIASGAGSLAPTGGFGAAFPSTTNPFLEGILGGMGGNGNNPFMQAGTRSNDSSSSLLSSLISSGNGSSGGGGSPLLGLMGDLFTPQPMINGKKSDRGSRGKNKKGTGGDSLAKSILSSLMKRIEDEDTQKTICDYLHSTNTQQVMQYATMAGIPMKEGSARRLATLANGVTPKGIRKSISKVKRGISIIKAVRKTFKVIEKYKYVIILTVTCYWIRSAIVEPYPIRRSKKQTQKLAQKAALSLILPARDVRGSLFGVSLGIAESLSRISLVIKDKFDDEVKDVRSSTMVIEKELEYLQNQLSFIEAIEVYHIFHPRQCFYFNLVSSKKMLRLLRLYSPSREMKPSLTHSSMRRINGIHLRRMKGYCYAAKTRFASG